MKICSSCGQQMSDNFIYCGNCGKKLNTPEKTYVSTSSYSSEPPYGYVYDFYGHLRKDPEIERQRQEELAKSWKDRW